MTIVTRQNLMAEKMRFLISVSGIALSVFLISFLLSLYQGWRLSVGRFVENVNADVWVAREGTTDFLNAASILPAEMQGELTQVPGVAKADAYIVRPMNFKVGGKTASAYLVGYEVDGGAGGPQHISKGKEAPGPGEVIIDEAYAEEAKVGIGGTVDSGQQHLKVVGISTGGDLVFSATIFVSLDTARSLLSMKGLSTFYLVHLSQGADGAQVIGAIGGRYTGIDAFTGHAFAAATRSRIMGQLVPILIVIVFLAFVVGVAITGLTIYNATVEKSREYGILKAIGFTNGYLFRLVLEQSMVTGLLGFIIGATGTFVATRFVGGFVPQFVTLVRWQDIVFVLITTILMSIVAALMPVRRITSVDPVTVFA